VTVVATLPTALAERDQFVLFRYSERDGKPTKVPYCARTPWREASTTDPSTWSSLDRALQMSHEADGIGFVFTAEDPFVGIDLDGCITEDGEIEQWAAEIVETLDSYTERSPSGCALHVFVKAKLNGSRRRADKFEVYEDGRYFTLTGERVGSRETIEERQGQLDAVVARMLPPIADRGQTRPACARRRSRITRSWSSRSRPITRRR
jgi:putative DNA primase/helicase